MNALEQWLSIATRGLSPESTARVRAEIEEHSGSAIASGVSETDAVVALGDPKAANGEYRKVLLTDTEAAVAPALLRPKALTVGSVLMEIAIFGAFFWIFARGRYGASVLPILIASCSEAPLRWVLTAYKFDDRVLRYASYANVLLVALVAWWSLGWSSAIMVGVIRVAVIWALNRPRASIQRKLDAGQVYGPFPGEPALTHPEAIFLRGLHQGPADQRLSKMLLVVMVVAAAIWQPRMFAPLLVMLVVRFTVPYLVPVYTAERSRWFRIGKWTLMVLAALLPVFLGDSWVPAAYVALMFVLFDARRVSLRRKLPVEEWPKELYL